MSDEIPMLDQLGCNRPIVAQESQQRVFYQSLRPIVRSLENLTRDKFYQSDKFAI